MKATSQNRKRAARAKVREGAVPAKALAAGFPPIALPIRPPFPPMEAQGVKEIPSAEGWQYEPKWDGFRCLAFKSGRKALLQSKSGQPLGRYFPELIEALLELPVPKFVLDGEIVIEHEGRLHFDELLQRIHPAASRIRRLAQETPAKLMIFDLLVDGAGKSLLLQPLVERRRRLEEFHRKFARSTAIELSPATTNLSQLERWMPRLVARGCDGVVAKLADSAYRSGERSAMVKIKRLRTADCVVGGFRYGSKGHHIGSLLLGLYNSAGKLDHVGFTASFRAEQRVELKKIVEPLRGGTGFTGGAPGGPSRWASERSAEWVPLKPELVCEVQYDHFSGWRFRHGTKFLRWRPDKAPRQCTFQQLEPSAKAA